MRNTSNYQQPGTAFSSRSMGDGFDVGFTTTGLVLNVYHHASTFAFDCHIKSSGASCPGTWPIFISGYLTSYQSDAIVVNDVLWSWGSSGPRGDPNQKGGIMKVNPDGTGFQFYPLTTATQTGLAFQSQSGPVGALNAKVGSKLYAINNCGGRGQVDGNDCNKLLCFDLDNMAACAGQPYSLTYPASYSASSSNSQTAWVYAIESNVYVFNIWKAGTSGQRGVVTCFDSTTRGVCAGAWPINVPDSAFDPTRLSTPQITSFMGYLNDGLCIGGGTSNNGADQTNVAGTSKPFCFSKMGATVATLNFSAQKNKWGPLSSLSFSNRGYFGQSRGVACFDFTTNAPCTNFPVVNLVADTSTYSVRSDPTNPRCLWVNGDSGYIANFDAFDGTIGCGTTYYTTVTFGLDLPSECNQTMTQWNTLKVTNPVGFGTANITIYDLEGNLLTSFIYVEGTEQDISMVPTVPDILVKTEFASLNSTNVDDQGVFSARVTFVASDRTCCPT